MTIRDSQRVQAETGFAQIRRTKFCLFLLTWITELESFTEHTHFQLTLFPSEAKNTNTDCVR